MTYDQQQDEWTRRTVAVVEATLTEQHYLWMQWASDSGWNYTDRPLPKVKWEQLSPGSIREIGRIKVGREKMPVCIQMFWVRINGQIVMFWSMCSQVTDYRMADKYLRKICNPTWDEGTRLSRHDAQNFHNAMWAVKQANGE